MSEEWCGQPWNTATRSERHAGWGRWSADLGRSGKRGDGPPRAISGGPELRILALDAAMPCQPRRSSLRRHCRQLARDWLVDAGEVGPLRCRRTWAWGWVDPAAVSCGRACRLGEEVTDAPPRRTGRKTGAWRDQPQVFPPRLNRGGRAALDRDGAVFATNEGAAVSGRRACQVSGAAAPSSVDRDPNGPRPVRGSVTRKRNRAAVPVYRETSVTPRRLRATFRREPSFRVVAEAVGVNRARPLREVGENRQHVGEHRPFAWYRVASTLPGSFRTPEGTGRPAVRCPRA